MKDKTLVFSIALNGYQWIYKKELKSQKRYAERFAYDYQSVTKPAFSPLGVECCWLKLTLMKSAFVAGYETVMFIDADAFVALNCPEVESVFLDDKHLYMAKGYSKRFNSGVIIARNKPKVLDWLSRVIDSRGEDVSEESNVGWGENGHIIELSKGCNFISEIEQKWNNTFDESMDNFIKHSNCGPLRTSLLRNYLHFMIFLLSNKILKTINKFNFIKDHIIPCDLLHSETSKIISRYQEFSSTKLRS